MKNKVIIFLKKFYPLIVCILVICFVFRQFIFKGLLPIPSDIITGVYYPWLNQRWGTITGVPVKNPLPSDIPSLLYPWRLQVRNQLFAGNFPLWNDQIFSGMPLFANFQSSVLSISNLLFLFVKNNGLAWSLGVFFQPIFMCFAAFLFFRKIKFSKIASLLGSLLYALNGFSTVWLEYNVHGWVLFWLPLMLLSTELIFKKNKWGNILLALSVCGSIFTGYPQLTLYSFLTVFLYTFIKLVYKQTDLKKIFTIGVFSAFGLFMSAILLLPGFESAKLSIRSVDTVATSTETRFLPFSYLTNLIAPDIHGNPATGNYTGLGYYDNFAIYIGVAAFVLLLIGLFSGKTSKRLKIFSVVLIFLGITLSTPNNIGILVGDLNLFGIKSIAARAMTLSIFGFIILAVSGLESLIHKIKFSDILLSIIPSIILGALYVSSSEPVFQRNLYLPIAASVAMVLSLLVGKFIKKIKVFVPIVVLLLLVFEVTRFANKYLSFTPEKYLFPETKIITSLKNKSDIQNSKVEFAEVIPENMWVPFGLRSAVGYDATAPLLYSRLLGMVGNKNLDHTQGRVGKLDQINKITNIIGVNYLFTLSTKDGKPDITGTVREELKAPAFTEVDSEGPVKLFRINGSSNTLNFYTQATPYKTEAEFIKLANTPSFDPAKEILVKDGEPLRLDGSSSLKIESQLPGNITVSVISETGGYVDLKQNRYPGWSVLVDNEKTDLLEADYAFMAVRVSPGSHIISFRYLPQTFIVGSIVSLLSFLVLLGLVFKYVRK